MGQGGTGGLGPGQSLPLLDGAGRGADGGGGGLRRRPQRCRLALRPADGRPPRPRPAQGLPVPELTAFSPQKQHLLNTPIRCRPGTLLHFVRAVAVSWV